MPIGINLDKAKDITHEVRRAKRAEEFAPLDIKATVPHLAAEAEAARASVRSKYEEIQTQIDSCSSVQELKQVIESL